MQRLKWLSWLILGAFLFLSLHIFLPLTTPAQSTPNTARFQTLAQADRLYLQGDLTGAERLYRQAKPAFATEHNSVTFQPITDAAQLSPAAQVYWRTVQEGIQQGLESKIFDPLQQLLNEQPEFIPGYTLYYEELKKADREEDAIAVLEQGISRFPDSIELTKALVAALEDNKDFLEASITARQFAIVYPDHPEAAAFTQSAEENLKRFRNRLTERNVVRGVLGSVIGVLTGDRGGRAIQNAALLLQGESGMGSQFVASFTQQTPLIRDPEIVEYVTKVGKSVAELMGRDFNYEFYVVQDENWNAFAVPGGKIFFNTGLMLGVNSEAEFAGVMAHEVAHAVLSHTFQRMTQVSLLSNLGSIIPFGDVASTLLSLDYSRHHERQSDLVGTRTLALSGYAADGLYNAFVGLKQQEKSKPPAYLSSHPLTDTRIRYLEEMIQRNGYNRYAYEGVERYTQIKDRLKKILAGESVSPSPMPSPTSTPQPAITPPTTPPTTPPNRSTASPSTTTSSAPSSASATSASTTAAPTTRTNRPPVSDIALAARQELNAVTIQFDGGQVNSAGSYEVNVIVENNSDRPFAFVPVFVKVQTADGEDVSARFSFEDPNHTAAEPGETLRGKLRVLGQDWQSSGSQGLTLVIREGTTGGRVFRIPIE